MAGKFILATLGGLIRLLIPASSARDGLGVMHWIVAVPNYAGTVTSPSGNSVYGFAGINALRDLFMWIGAALLPLTLVYATSRAALGAGGHPVAPVGRVLGIGGSDSHLGSRTGGERLRLRLATVIALLRVAARLGVGRHPGLVLIDSPGGEEMVEGDLAAILTELGAVCEELPALQLICATARAEEVRRVVPEDHIIHGPEYAEVW